MPLCAAGPGREGGTGEVSQKVGERRRACGQIIGKGCRLTPPKSWGRLSAQWLENRRKSAGRVGKKTEESRRLCAPKRGGRLLSAPGRKPVKISRALTEKHGIISRLYDPRNGKRPPVTGGLRWPGFWGITQIIQSFA